MVTISAALVPTVVPPLFFHTYETYPVLAVSVILVPGQNEEGPVMVGGVNGKRDVVIAGEVPEHPDALVTVTVKLSAEYTLTVWLVPMIVPIPFFH